MLWQINWTTLALSLSSASTADMCCSRSLLHQIKVEKLDQRTEKLCIYWIKGVIDNVWFGYAAVVSWISHFIVGTKWNWVGTNRLRNALLEDCNFVKTTRNKEEKCQINYGEIKQSCALWVWEKMEIRLVLECFLKLTKN